MLLTLPAELTVNILGYLSLRDVTAVLRVSSALAKLVGENEPAVYHSVALRQGYAQPQDTLDSCRTADPSVLGVGKLDWKELCRRRAVFDKNWKGQGTYLEGAFLAVDTQLLSLCIDEEQRNALLFDSTGGIIVRALESGNVLWAHSEFLGRSSQLLFSDGYLAARDTDSQGDLVVRTWRRGPARGAFVAHKTLHAPPHLGVRMLMHMAHGTLAVCAMHSNSVMLFDVRSGALRATVAVLDYLDSAWMAGLGGAYFVATMVADVFIGPDSLSICFSEVVLVMPMKKSGAPLTGDLQMARTALTLPSTDAYLRRTRTSVRCM